MELVICERFYIFIFYKTLQIQLMKKIVTLFLISAFFCSCQTTLKPKVASQSEPTTKTDLQNGAWVSLFNGKNLDGWINHGSEKWYVENGELICESGPKAEYGYLSTVDFYDDFELSLEFKQEANGNSGVFIRSTLERTKITGWQAEVAPPKNNTGGIYESYGRGWLIKPDPKKDNALK